MTKKTIVLLSGWLHNFENETKFVKKLNKYFKIVVIKYPGYYGEKDFDKLPNKYDLADLTYSKIRNLGLKNFYILGFSMGCQVVLHTVMKYKLKNKLILISPTTQTLENEVPYFVKPFLKNRGLFKIVRKSDLLSTLLVNMAYKKISKITENGHLGKKAFSNSKISTKGAFDTLYFLVTSFINPTTYKNQTTFIFGEKEILQKGFIAKFKTIKNMGHGGFDQHCNELSEVIRSSV